MKDFLECFKPIFIALVVLILFCVGVGWVVSGITSRKINMRYGTDYTTSDMFWYGDKIVISDHIKIKDNKK